MKKRRMLILCIAVIIAVAFNIITLSVFAAADRQVNFSVRFDKENYLPGEDVVAEVCIGGLGDEAAAEMLLGTIETHLYFEGLEYVNSSSELGSKAYRTENDVLVFFDDISGKKFWQNSDWNAESGELIIAKLYFKALEDGTSSASIRFRDENLDNPADADSGFSSLVLGHYNGDITIAEARWNCETYVSTSDFLNIKEYIIEADASAIYSDNKISFGLNVRRGDTASGAVFIAKLYKSDNALIAPAFTKVIEAGAAADTLITVTFDDIYNYSADYKITYYLWDSFVNLNPRIPSEPISVINGIEE